MMEDAALLGLAHDVGKSLGELQQWMKSRGVTPDMIPRLHAELRKLRARRREEERQTRAQHQVRVQESHEPNRGLDALLAHEMPRQSQQNRGALPEPSLA